MVDYINPADSSKWQAYRQQFEDKVQQWCIKNNIGFFGTYHRISESAFTKLVKLTIFELVMSSDDLTQLDVKLGNSGKHLYYLTDNIVDTTQTKKLKNITFISINELFGMIDCQKISNNTQTSPSRLFNCFIQRVESVRQSWFYFLNTVQCL